MTLELELLQAALPGVLASNVHYNTYSADIFCTNMVSMASFCAYMLSFFYTHP
jgi:hypothetical protein